MTGVTVVEDDGVTVWCEGDGATVWWRVRQCGVRMMV